MAENMLTRVDRIILSKCVRSDDDEVLSTVILYKIQADSLRFLAEAGSVRSMFVLYMCRRTTISMRQCPIQSTMWCLPYTV